MQDPTKINGAQGFGPLVEDFHAIKALNEFYVANGWDCRYQQIGKGPLRVEVVSRVMESLVIGSVSVSQRLWGHARSCDGMMSVSLYLNKADVAINGLRMNQDRLWIIPPNLDVDIVLGQCTNPLTILVPVDTYESYGLTIGGSEFAPATSKIAAIDVGRENLDPLRRLALGFLGEYPKKEDVSALEDTLLKELVRLVKKHKSDVLTRDPYNRLRKHDNILRVIQYIHEHLVEDISVESVCENGGISLSTLERRFNHFLQVTPKQYILAARLNRARRDLLDPLDFDHSIAELAMRNRLLHMGRFSENYKAQFGQLPSEERDIAMNGDQ